ncbi:MAG: hypothetical protein QW117_00570 [Candidatus Pacearchaeota archaeon]
MNKWLELLIGLILLVGAIIFAFNSANWGAFWNFKHAAWEFFKGGLIWFVILIGVLFIILGISDLKE